MIKLTKLILSVKDSTEDLIEELSIEYSKEVEDAENIGLPRPKAPKYKMSLKDYDVKEVIYYVDKSRIIDVSEDVDGFTIIGVEGLDSDVSVKQTVEEVIKLIADEQ
jgi:hypothetical protein